MILKTKKINSLSKLPEQAHKGDMFDLFANEDIVLNSFKSKIVSERINLLTSYMYNFIFFLQNNKEVTQLIPLELYKQIMKVIRQDNKMIKRKLLKSTSYYIQAFFNHNNQYITPFYNCIEIIKKGNLCI